MSATKRAAAVARREAGCCQPVEIRRYHAGGTLFDRDTYLMTGDGQYDLEQSFTPASSAASDLRDNIATAMAAFGVLGDGYQIRVPNDAAHKVGHDDRRLAAEAARTKRTADLAVLYSKGAATDAEKVEHLTKLGNARTAEQDAELEELTA